MPAAICKQHGLAYFSIPKAASTSVKLAFYEVVYGEPFNKKLVHLHPTFPTRPITDEDFAETDGFWRFAIIRDPISRLLSAYGNRVLKHRDILRDAAPRRRDQLLFRFRHPGLRIFPDQDAFYCNLERYQSVSYSIWHHTIPASSFIGSDLSRFDAIYKVEELSEFEAEISRRTGRKIRLTHEQTAGEKIRFEMLSPKAQEVVLAKTNEDYELFSDFYKRP